MFAVKSGGEPATVQTRRMVHERRQTPGFARQAATRRRRIKIRALNPNLSRGEQSRRGGAAKRGGYSARLEKYQQLNHRHAPSFIRHVLDAFRQYTLTAGHAAEQLGLSPSRLYALANAYNTARTGHHSVLAAAPDPHQKPVLLFTNRHQ